MTTTVDAVLTANDRLKRRFEGTLALSLMLATLLHLSVFALWPDMTAESWAPPPEQTLDVLQLQEIDIPPQPDQIARPAAPVISTDVSVEQTIPAIGFEEYVELPPPPAEPATRGTGETIPFTPYTTAPTLLNGPVVQRALERAYPPSLRDAGIGGTVSLLVHIDAQGGVTDARVGTGSGYDAFDEVALGLADMMEFRPAMNRDRYVAVWIQIPLTFQVR